MVWQEGKNFDGVDKSQLSQWFSFLIMILRDELVLYSGSPVKLYNQQDIAKISKFTGRISQSKLTAFLKLAREYQGRLRYRVASRLMMESFVIKVKDLLEE